MASAVARTRQGNGAAGQRGQSRAPRYERSSPMANNARAADSAPPATAASLALLNAELGANWFSHRVVKAGNARQDKQPGVTAGE